MFHIIRRITVATIFILSMMALNSAETVVAQQNASVRVIHTSPDVPAVDVFVDGQQVVAALGFTQASSYLPVMPGEHRFQIFLTGSGPGGNPLIDTTAEVEAGQAYTVMAVNSLRQIEAVVLSDKIAPPEGNGANIRMVHASFDAPAIDVVGRSGAVTFDNLSFKAASDYKSADAGSYQFDVLPTDSTDPVLMTDDLTFEAGRNYTVIVQGQVSEGSLQVVVYQDAVRQGTIAQLPGMPSTGGGGMSASPSSSFPTWLVVFVTAAALLPLFGGILRRQISRRQP